MDHSEIFVLGVHVQTNKRPLTNLPMSYFDSGAILNPKCCLTLQEVGSSITILIKRENEQTKLMSTLVEVMCCYLKLWFLLLFMGYVLCY